MTTTADNEGAQVLHEKPGLQLERLREKKGFTQEYVAGRLHLRVKIVSLLEKDEYTFLPEPVFIKGYLRAYAKLLDVNPEPFLISFNNHYSVEKKPEKTLWQNKRETNRSEIFVRLFTAFLLVSVLITIGIWWYKNKEEQAIVTNKNSERMAAVETKTMAEPEVRLTDLSKMSSMFSSPTVNLDNKSGTQNNE